MDGFEISGASFIKATGFTPKANKTEASNFTVPLGATRAIDNNSTKFTLRADPAYGQLSEQTTAGLTQYIDLLEF